MSKSKSKSKSKPQSQSQPQAQLQSSAKSQPPAKSQSQPAQQKPAHGTLVVIALVLVILSNLFMTAVYWSTRRQDANSPLGVTLMLLISLASVVAGVAMWYWKRWGLYVYAGTAIASAVVVLLLTGDLFMVFGAILPPIIVAYILKPKMQHFS